MFHAADLVIAIVVAALLARWAALVIGAIVERVRERRDPAPDAPPGPRDAWPLITVLVPAKDEQRALASTVEAVLASDYPKLEVLVIDDGSTDATPRIAAALAAADPRVEVITQPVNRGKAAALNRGLRRARGELVVTVDADTRPAPDCVRRLAAHLLDGDAVAVACNVKVDNRGSWLGALQTLEYVAELGVDQRALSWSDAITVVAGATAGWRRDAVLAVGGFSSRTLTEDTDLTITLQRTGHAVRYAADAITYTTAPATLSALVKQRRRWLTGNLQTAWAHRDALWRAAPSIRFIALPNWWFINLGVFLLVPLWAAYLPHGLTHYAWPTALAIMALALAFEVAHGALAHALDREPMAWVLLAPVQRFIWPFFLWGVFATVVVTRLRGRRVGWRETTALEQDR